MAPSNISSPIILLIGPPGAGKGTLGKFLKQQIGVEHISVGDLLRRVVNEPPADDWKVQLKATMEENKLVPSRSLMILLRKELQIAERKKPLKAFLIDGFPRSKEQADSFEDWVSFDGAADHECC